MILLDVRTSPGDGRVRPPQRGRIRDLGLELRAASGARQRLQVSFEAGATPTEVAATLRRLAARVEALEG